MRLYINKKIILYIFFLLLFGTINNINLSKLNFLEIENLQVSGIDYKDYPFIDEKIKDLKFKNILLLKKENFIQIKNSDNIIEDISVFKIYPSSLEIKIKKTDLLANILIDGNFYFLGSNGKLIESNEIKEGIPNIVGKVSYENFIEIKRKIDLSKIEFKNLKNLFFFPSGRWDIELNSGILLRLPLKNTIQALNNSFKLLDSENFKKVKVVDLRVRNQIIINEE